MMTAVNFDTPHRHVRKMDDDQQRLGNNSCTPQGCSIEKAPPPKTSPMPPCLTNLLVDTDHPDCFEFTPEHLDLIKGAAGSCLDVFKTHVASTVGAKPFIRALGKIDQDTLCALVSQALTAQGLPTTEAPALAGMAAEAAVILLEDHIATTVADKLQTVSWLTDSLLAKPSLRKDLLVEASMISDPTARKNLLQCFGVDPGDAKKIGKLLAEWIPQEITTPTSHSVYDVDAAEKLLLDGLESLDKDIDGLIESFETWQVSKEIDMIADLGSELGKVFKDLGLAPPGPKNGSALGQAVEGHIEQIEHDRLVDGLVDAGITALGSFALGGPLVALVGSLPSLIANHQRLDDMQVLQGLGSADDESVEEAELNLAKSYVMLAVSLTAGGPIP